MSDHVQNLHQHSAELRCIECRGVPEGEKRDSDCTEVWRATEVMGALEALTELKTAAWAACFRTDRVEVPCLGRRQRQDHPDRHLGPAASFWA